MHLWTICILDIFLFVSVCWWDGRSITKLPLLVQVIRTFATVTISLCVSVNWPQYHDIVICGALSRWSSHLGNVRGAFLAKGPDSSVGGVPVGYCPDEVHMEEEEVQVKVQTEEEEEIGETHRKEQGEE